MKEYILKHLLKWFWRRTPIYLLFLPSFAETFAPSLPPPIVVVPSTVEGLAPWGSNTTQTVEEGQGPTWNHWMLFNTNILPRIMHPFNLIIKG
jgi:membrane protein YqaA with SNARE-associated domain